MKKTFPYHFILIVCSANTARSCMAEGFLKEFFLKIGLDINVSSGGIATNARDGMLISMDAKLAMKEVGITLSETSTSLDLRKHHELVEKADLILTLTENHKKKIQEFFNVISKEIMTIKEFAGESGDIEDPSMKEELFKKVRDEIVEYLMKGLNKYQF
jgi:protein-tyrosine phosphatase